MAAMPIGEEEALVHLHFHAKPQGGKRREEKRMDGRQICARSHINFFVPKARSFKLGGECSGRGRVLSASISSVKAHYPVDKNPAALTLIIAKSTKKEFK